MKISRVVNYGCSHAYGSEMSGRADDTGHYDLNYGNIVANHLNVDFEIYAKPGTGNDYMLNAVIENVRPGDLCLLSWTNFRREQYYHIEDCPTIPSCQYTEYEIIKIMKHITPSNDASILKGMFKREGINSMSKTTDIVDQCIKEMGGTIPFIKNIDNKILHKIAEYNVFYAWELLPIFVKYLQLYNSVNAIIQHNGATAINFIFAENSEVLKQMELCSDQLKINSTGGKLHDTMLYKNWAEDPLRIKPIAPKWRSMNEVACNITGVPEFEYPGNRMGHYGPAEHEVIGKMLINKYEELKCQ